MATARAEWRRIHEAGLRDMLAVEELSLAALSAVLAEVTQTVPDTEAQLRDSMVRLASALAPVIQTQRRAGRVSGLRQVRKRLVALRSYGMVPRAEKITDADLRADAARASRVAKRAAGRFFKWVTTEAERAESFADAFLASEAKMGRHVEMVAITETADSWADEVRTQGRRYQEKQRDNALVPVIIKEWDATLDRRTCPICEGANGVMRPLGISFPLGAPGSVHPRCRCQEMWWPLVLLLPSERDDMAESMAEAA